MIYAKEKPEDAVRVIGKERWWQIQKETGGEGGLGHKSDLTKHERVLNKIGKVEIYLLNDFEECVRLTPDRFLKTCQVLRSRLCYCTNVGI